MKKRKINIKKTIVNIVILILMIIILYNGAVIIKWYFNGREIGKLTQEISDIIEIEEVDEGEPVNEPEDELNDYWYYINLPLNKVDLTLLKSQNSDTVGFITVNGTNINYPIVQASNNDYYLTRSFKKEYNDAGWIFADYRNNMTSLDNNTVIYGHARLDGVLFGTLKNVLKSSWINNKDNYIIKMSTEYENTMWQVFSVYKIKAENYYIQTSFTSDSEYSEWLNTMISRSEYNFNTSVNTSDKIITLSTCYDDRGTRVVMQAKLIKKSVNN